MTTFDLHIIRRFVATVFVLMGVLTIFFILLHYLEYIDNFIDNGAPEKEILYRYYPSAIPDILRQIAPISVFLSSIYLTGKLAQQLQITALYTTGVSLYRIFWPFLVVGLFFTAGMFYLNGWIVPKANQVRIEMEAKYLRSGGELLEDNSNIFRQVTPTSILSIGFYNASTQDGQQALVMKFDKNKHLAERLDADRMVWDAKGKKWRLTTNVRHRFVNDSTTAVQRIAQIDTSLSSLPRDLARSVNDIQLLNIQEADDYIRELERAGVDELERSRVDYYSKFTYPLANLIVIFVGVALASVRRKGGQAVQMSIGLMVAFVYLSFVKVFEPLGYAGTIPPLLASIFPHALFFALGLILLITARK